MAASGSIWRCEECGWRWPLANVPWQNSECDACGGTMAPEEPLQYTDADRAYDRQAFARDYGLREA